MDYRFSNRNVYAQKTALPFCSESLIGPSPCFYKQRLSLNKEAGLCNVTVWAVLKSWRPIIINTDVELKESTYLVLLETIKLMAAFKTNKTLSLMEGEIH